MEMKIYIDKNLPDNHKFYHSLIPLSIGLKIEKLLSLLYDRGVPKFIDDIVSGMISGIPICCVVYYSRGKRDNRNGNIYYSYVGYVACPYCLEHSRFAGRYKDWIKVIRLCNEEE
jgi:hypothetical protein